MNSNTDIVLPLSLEDMRYALGYSVFVSLNPHDDSKLCAVASTTGSNNIVQLTCHKPLVGQYLKISRANSVYGKMHNYLVLCEVEVWGQPTSYIKTGN